MSATKKQVRQQFYTFRPNKPSPLDDRLDVASLSTLDDDLPAAERYPGMFFWVDDAAAFYCFLADVTVPVDFMTALASGIVTGIEWPTPSDWAGLPAVLEALNPQLGQVVTVYPLGVSFIFNGTSFVSAYGKYTLASIPAWDTLDSSLKRVGALAGVAGVAYVVDGDLSLSAPVIVADSVPGTLENGRFYMINGVLWYSTNGVIYKTGPNTFIGAGTALAAGSTAIAHGLNSPYVRGIIWIDGMDTLCDLSLTYVDANNSTIDSRAAVTGTVVIVADN